MAVCACFSVEDAGAGSRARADTLIVPAGTKAKVDGVVRREEWADADTLEIQAGPGWVVPVLLKHDGEALYVAFSNLVEGRAERYPEVMLDVSGDGGAWDDNDWWLHASHDDCTGRGFYAVYGHTCAQDAEGWYANNFPLRSPHAIEIRISFTLVDMGVSRSGTSPVFRLALAVADSESRGVGAGNPRGEQGEAHPHERRFQWPPFANMLPASWAAARLAPVPPRAKR